MRYTRRYTADEMEGSRWKRRKSVNRHENVIEILRCLQSRRGVRYLVQGSVSGRQWTLSHATLLSSYTLKEASENE